MSRIPDPAICPLVHARLLRLSLAGQNAILQKENRVIKILELQNRDKLQQNYKAWHCVVSKVSLKVFLRFSPVVGL